MKDTKFIDGLRAALNSPNFIERRRQVMFGRKSDPNLKVDVSQIPKQYPTENTKACTDCGCIVLATKIKQVEYWSYHGRVVFFYCARCKPPYDKMTYNIEEAIYERRVPEHYVLVTREGATIVKCEKIKSKKVAKNAKK